MIFLAYLYNLTRYYWLVAILLISYALSQWKRLYRENNEMVVYKAYHNVK